MGSGRSRTEFTRERWRVRSDAKRKRQNRNRANPGDFRNMAQAVASIHEKVFDDGHSQTCDCRAPLKLRCRTRGEQRSSLLSWTSAAISSSIFFEMLLNFCGEIVAEATAAK